MHVFCSNTKDHELLSYSVKYEVNDTTQDAIVEEI